MLGSKYYSVHHMNVLKDKYLILNNVFFFTSFPFCITDNHPKNNAAVNGNQCLSTCPKTKKYFNNLCIITINRSVVNLVRNYSFFGRIV